MDPFIGEIRIFAGNFAPQPDWAFCDGSKLSITENDALYSLIGTTYGGDGSTYFQLPDLRGRLPVDVGSTIALGQVGGSETVALSVNELPAHNHALYGSTSAANGANPKGAVLAQASTFFPYLNATPANAMNAGSIQPSGGSQPHENRQPFLCISYIIALNGIYPSRT